MVACLDDVQKFGNAIAAGKPFDSQGTSRRVSKRGGDKDDNPDEASDQESESVSDHQRPVVVSDLVLAPILI
jgi:hypothetical protein